MSNWLKCADGKFHKFLVKMGKIRRCPGPLKGLCGYELPVGEVGLDSRVTTGISLENVCDDCVDKQKVRKKAKKKKK